VVLFAPVARSAPSRWPTSPEARRFHFPPGWLVRSGVWCLHRHESVDWHRRWVDWAGRPSPYAGGLQFMQHTWETAGGRGEPWQWSVREQVYRAFVRWHADGDSWSEWGTAGACGLR
jgi:hypothetical protein